MNYFLRILLASLTLLLPFSHAHARGKLKVIATFSVLGDMVKHVAYNDIDLKVLVGPNGDTHEYQPTPTDAKDIAKADLVIMNGAKLEGWLDRLIQSSGYKGPVVEATKGISLLTSQEEGQKAGAPDPHAWQNAANGKIYVTNIRDALIAADRAHASDYRKNAETYIKQIDAIDAWIKESIATVPEKKRIAIISHDALQYFGVAYKLKFLAAQGISTESQPSAANMAKLIKQIRKKKITAVFLENMTDSRLVKQLEKDAGAHIGGTLYTDALSDPKGPAPTYLDMFKHNVPELLKGLQQNPVR
ncbi:metal ABC transporter substrate-binding protein [Liberibacter crescens]|nr:metal ABC transporter substrate-binding protein [Liberibacter crescens]AMC13370.1 metal ABC transporter substrate-binding protein [Liberibacter crescens]